jgi:hypothetical protein
MKVPWPWSPPRRGDIAALVLLAVILLAVASGVVLPIARLGNWGFGPEWRCASVGKGDPIRVKGGAPRPPDASRP